MKKILLSVLIATSIATPAFAHGYYRGYGGWGYNDWVAPLIIGGVIGYSLSNPYPVYQQPNVIYTQPAPVVVPNNASQPGQYYYFCSQANGYYPYVSSCPSGWTVVPATPPN